MRTSYPDRGSVRDLAADLARHAEALCGELLPAGRRDNQYWRVGSLSGERGSSLAVRLTGAPPGRWADYATGDHGDLIDLIREIHGGTVADTIKWARRWLGGAL